MSLEGCKMLLQHPTMPCRAPLPRHQSGGENNADSSPHCFHHPNWLWQWEGGAISTAWSHAVNAVHNPLVRHWVECSLLDSYATGRAVVAAFLWLQLRQWNGWSCGKVPHEHGTSLWNKSKMCTAYAWSFIIPRDHEFPHVLLGTNKIHWLETFKFVFIVCVCRSCKALG